MTEQHRLTKSDVETLMASYDHDPIAALTTALRHLLGRAADWPELVTTAGFEPQRAAALLRADQQSLDQLAAELNELRRLAR